MFRRMSTQRACLIALCGCAMLGCHGDNAKQTAETEGAWSVETRAALQIRSPDNGRFSFRGSERPDGYHPDGLWLPMPMRGKSWFLTVRVSS